MLLDLVRWKLEGPGSESQRWLRALSAPHTSARPSLMLPWLNEGEIPAAELQKLGGGGGEGVAVVSADELVWAEG